MSKETRRFIEFRFDDSGEDGPVLRGYAAVFESDSVFMGFTERIKPGAFTRTLQENDDIKALVEHDTGNIIARTGNDSLTLREDDHGLYVEIKPNQTSYAMDLVENVRTGLLDSMSFGFHVVKDSWERSEGQNIRTLIDVDLIEVSVVSTPAYQASEIALRNLEQALATQEADEDLEDDVHADNQKADIEPKQTNQVEMMIKKLDLMDREI